MSVLQGMGWDDCRRQKDMVLQLNPSLIIMIKRMIVSYSSGATSFPAVTVNK